MANVLMFIAQNLSSLACVIGAIYLAGRNSDNWGWFLLCGLLLQASPNFIKAAFNSGVASEEAADAKGQTSGQISLEVTPQI